MKTSGRAPEELRRDTLEQYRIRGAESPAGLGEIVRLAANLCGAPIASLNFVGEIIWSEACVGLDTIHPDPSQSFCQRVVIASAPLHVPNALLDPVYSEFAIVKAGPAVRSYLGVPVLSPDGSAIGALCLLDTVPRLFTEADREHLELFARQIMTILELQRQTSALHATQKELHKQQSILADSKKHHRDFISNFSHEIRNPLHAILGLTDILKEQGLKPHQNQLLQNLTHSSHHMMETLNTLLEHSKMESGVVKLSPSYFDLQVFLEETVAPFVTLAEKKGVAFSSSASLRDHVLCHGDKVRLRQILSNLVGNALKFTEQGGSIKVELECSETRGDESLFSFRIIDSGIGIERADQGLLFEPFRQVSGDPSKGGTGLGLSICRKIVDSMGGQIGLESELGKGSTFWFMIPLKTTRQIEPSSIRTAAPQEAPLEGRVLLLEDNSLSSAMAVSYLEKAGLEVLSASTLASCLDLLDCHDFDIILMDLHLGAVLPATLLHEVRQKSCAPIIAISGSPVDTFKGLEFGIDDSLQKPFGREALRSMLQKWLLDRKDENAYIREWSQSLSRLEEQCGPEFLNTTIENFVTRHPVEIHKFHRYLEEASWDKLELAAHSMKSTLATLGLMHLARLATEIEAIASSADRSLVETALGQFRIDSRRTYNALLNYVKIEFSSREKAS